MNTFTQVKHKLMKVVHASALSLQKTGKITKKKNSSSGLLSVIKKECKKAKCAEVQKALWKAKPSGLISCFYG